MDIATSFPPQETHTNELDDPGRSGIRAAVNPRGVPQALLAVTPGFSIPSTLPATPVRGWAAEPLIASWTQENDICCAVVESSFGGGHGLDLILRLRAQRPLTPIMFYNPSNRARVARLAKSHSFEVASGAYPEQEIQRFVTEASSRPRYAGVVLENWLLSLSQRCQFTPCEQRLAAAVVQGRSRQELLEMFDVTVNTLKSHTRSLLKKTGHSSLDSLGREALKIMLQG